MICGHVFHVKQQKILFEVFLLLENVLECPCQEAFGFLKGFTEQVATLKGCLEEMEQRLKAGGFVFRDLEEIWNLVGKGVKKENLFVLAEKEVERFCYGYVEKQLYWHLRYYWDLLTEWMEDFQTEIAVKAGFMGVDCSDGLHPVKIQNLVMKALSYLTMMRTNYFGLRDMLIEIIDKKGRGEGKFLRGFEDDKEKELVLYAITLGIPENYSKELCGLLPLYKEVKMYKQVRYLKSIREFKEPLGDIYEGTIEARNFMALLKSFD
ncbi:unnamed protein product [Moneuplotes crassus]|uniref:Uncharacterized protein n=1 Tax=Euplotes crassus TaxID=5936 RepID=A0AAD1XKH5_EUPCR|nr:unnamed protein product [Moneuplotes crassus]